LKSVQKIDLGLTGYDELFMNDAERKENKLPRIYDIPLSEIDNFPDHPFKVKLDEDMDQLVQSIKERGIITPVTLRPKEDGRYEIVSGHRRKKACELAGFDTVKAEVREMTRDEAIILMVESNLQRSVILPSEKAFSYKMRLEAMDDTPYTVKVDQNGAVVEIEITNKLIRGSVQLTKVDKRYPDHHLSGAVFEVYRDGKLVSQMEELSDGVYKLDHLPYDDYMLKETKAPKGFVLDEKTYSFSIKEDGKTVVVENEAGKGFVNQAQTGGIRIEKTSDDGVLKGFTFRVEGTDITGNAFSKDFVTDEKGQIHIDGLRIGDYVISEVSNKANEKYELPANVTVTVHEGKTVVAKFHNKLKPVTDIPKTGDTTNMPLWAALAGISAIGAGAVAFFTFRKKKEVGKHER
jgi:LPXTG-motif cell wall-anchored protein